MDFPFIGPAYLHRSPNVAAQRCVNLYPEVTEVSNEPKRTSLIGVPGKDLFILLPTAPIRGQWAATMDGRAFAVAGNTLYELFANGTYVSRGTVNTGSGRVSIADNGLQMMIVDGRTGYVLTLESNVFAGITDVDFPGADLVSFQDGYFVFNIPKTGEFGITALYDGFDVNGLDFATAEGSPDNLISLLSDHRELWLFGSLSTEVFFNSGNSSFPFERIQGAFMEHGCAAKFSPAKLDNSVYWLGQDDKGRGMVFKAQNYQPARISTHALETAINRYSDISDATSYTYQEEGHTFYVLNFPTGNATWVYDPAASAQTGQPAWHERAYTEVNGTLSRDRAENHIFAFGKHLVGDWKTGAVYQTSVDHYSDYDRPLTAIRACPHSNNGGKNTFYGCFEILMESGVGLDHGVQGSNPQIMLQWSNDGGHTWQTEKWRSMGRIGAFKYRANWERGGKSRDRVYRIKITDPVKRIFVGATVDAMSAET